MEFTIVDSNHLESSGAIELPDSEDDTVGRNLSKASPTVRQTIIINNITNQ
jgi:hypothetical protein